MKKFYLIITSICFLILTYSCTEISRKETNNQKSYYKSCKPYTRWWWFASVIEKEDIKYQLNWLKEKGFGGVEIAFIYPVNRDPGAERIEWLSPEWTDVVTYAKYYSDSIGLGCDFTFGTLWPFGGTFVSDADRTKVFGNPGFKQPLRLSWTHPDTGNVLDHMNSKAFERYAEVMGDALGPALKGSPSALFCDSWEVETRHIWTDGFGDRFQEVYGYDIRPYMKNIYSKEYADERYDYMKLVAEFILENFYIPFTDASHNLGAFSRAQCSGSLTDLMTAYAVIDIPETEAMLYEPNFSRIVASSAALAGKRIVSAETFTCLYGWPREYLDREQTADLKLVADALFANGTNQIFWHGMPYNPEGVDSIRFYATVHVGSTGSLSKEFKAFNEYLTKVSTVMRKGKTYSDVAVYLPLEDSWIAGVYPEELQMPWSWGEYELRYVHFPDELDGYFPLWINHHFLKKGIVENKVFSVGDLQFKSLYVDVNYMNMEALETIYKLTKKGLAICLKKIPEQPGKNKSDKYQKLIDNIKKLPDVSEDFLKIHPAKPLISGEGIPDHWCREENDKLWIFFSHPYATNLTYPLQFGQAYCDEKIVKEVTINWKNNIVSVKLLFEPYQSILIQLDTSGNVSLEDIYFLPETPEKDY